MRSWNFMLPNAPTSSTGSGGSSSKSSTFSPSSSGSKSDHDDVRKKGIASEVERLLRVYGVDDSVINSIIAEITRDTNASNNLSNDNWRSLLAYLKGDSANQLNLRMNTEVLQKLGIILNLSKDFTEKLIGELTKGAALTNK